MELGPLAVTLAELMEKKGQIDGADSEPWND